MSAQHLAFTQAQIVQRYKGLPPAIKLPRNSFNKSRQTLRWRREVGGERFSLGEVPQQNEGKRSPLCETIFLFLAVLVQKLRSGPLADDSKSFSFIAFSPLRPGGGNPSRLECDLRLLQVARYRRIAQFGRAPLLQGGGRRFDSCSAYQRCLSGVGGGWRVVLLADVGKAGTPSLASRP